MKISRFFRCFFSILFFIAFGAWFGATIMNTLACATVFLLLFAALIGLKIGSSGRTLNHSLEKIFEGFKTILLNGSCLFGAAVIGSILEQYAKYYAFAALLLGILFACILLGRFVFTQDNKQYQQ